MVAQIPRPFRPTEAKRREDERARLAERRDGSRKTSNTTVSSGGRLDIDGGDLTVKNGGSTVVKDGGVLLVQGGGSAEIVDDGKIRATGQSIDPLDGRRAKSSAALEVRQVLHSTGVTLRTPGVYFETEFGAGGSITAENGRNPVMASGEKASAPPGTPGRLASSSRIVAGDVAAVLGANKFDPDANGALRAKANTTLILSPSRLDFKLWDVAAGVQASIEVDSAYPKMYLSAKNGVDVSGPFTVDGLPISGGATVVPRWEKSGTTSAPDSTAWGPGRVTADPALSTDLGLVTMVTQDVAQVRDAGLYAISFSMKFPTGASATNARSGASVEPMTGPAMAKGPVVQGDNQGTASIANVYLTAGQQFHLYIVQISGATRAMDFTIRIAKLSS